MEEKTWVRVSRETLVENQLKEYVKQTNHRNRRIKGYFSQPITNEIDRNTLLLRISEKERYMALNQIKLKKEEDRRQN